jgi:F0F1-type ATP synthase assembly protein I
MTQKTKSGSDIGSTYREVGPYLGLGTQLAATIILMFFLGRWLDGEFDTSPLLTICFSFLGGFAGIYNFIRAVLNLNKRNKIENED